ncbi:MAG: type IV pilin N-terminal domain-containing protein, partial [Methanomicrobiales archaeon]|nr:type IV pilin N-terminal domain-containing protein [Methanomicrobiales archaeon]
MNIKRQKDAAVSPVVGVLLMLVITIIIAAVVSGFAGGLIENKPKTPQASLKVEIIVKDLDAGLYEMFIEHRSGDPVDTARTELITSWTQTVDNSGPLPVPKSPPEIHYARTVPLV